MNRAVSDNMKLNNLASINNEVWVGDTVTLTHGNVSTLRAWRLQMCKMPSKEARSLQMHLLVEPLIRLERVSWPVGEQEI